MKIITKTPDTQTDLQRYFKHENKISLTVNWSQIYFNRCSLIRIDIKMTVHQLVAYTIGLFDNNFYYLFNDPINTFF